jgi:hypothetical protein
MKLEVLNRHGIPFMMVTNLKDMYTPEQVKEIADGGYTFLLNGQPVAPDDVIVETMKASLRERLENDCRG